MGRDEFFGGAPQVVSFSLVDDDTMMPGEPPKRDSRILSDFSINSVANFFLCRIPQVIFEESREWTCCGPSTK